ncbi:TonB-linked outer membrane protein, SusC/RagA family [Flavobacterium akiainvivens]|nr:TonB-linked outer membrane protein, SusC/RagA family [Flavobacterium akiainvivens]
MFMIRITNLSMAATGQLSKLKVALCAVFLLAAVALQAQNVTVSGQVTAAEDGSGLALANVLVKGTTKVVNTDIDGNYSIEVKTTDVLVFSYMGYAEQEVVVGNQTTINISLSQDATTMDELVVVGYGTQKKSDLTGAVAVVNVADAKKTVTYDVAKMLQGQAAGVTVQSSGEPGGFVNIKIRGMSSFSNNNPLFVVDNILVDNPYDFAPGDIESIQVLKDASAAAIYGVRGANGVVIITTKKGKAGKVSINFRSLTGFQNVGRKIDVTNREQYQDITNAAYLNSGQAILPGNDPNSPSYINNVDTNWQDEAFRTGRIENHSLSFTAGSEALSYNFNVDYFKNTSYLKVPQAYERYSTNLNVTGQKGRFKYGGKISYTSSDKENFNSYNGESAMMALLQAIPTMPVYDPNRLGGYGGADNLTQRAITLNVIGFNNLINNNTDRNRFVGNIWGEFEIIKGLRYTLRASADQFNGFNRFFTPPSDLGWYYITENAESALSINNDKNVRTIVDNLLNYDVTLGKHNISLMAGHVMESESYHNHWSRGVGYTPGENSQLNYADAISGGEYQSEIRRKSLLGRLVYTFDDTYILTANFRQDKSSLFPENNNTGNYYSVSGAWKAQNDLKLPEWWNTLKVRGGYGLLGNNTIGVYAYAPTVNPFTSYVFGTSLAPGTSVISAFDSSISWEETQTSNIAIETGMFDNKLQFSAEYYVKKSTGLLLAVPLPFSTGAFPASIRTNAGDIRNTGLEFTLGYSNYDHEFKWGVNANLGTIKNEVLRLGDENDPLFGINSKTAVGRSTGEIFVYEAEGIFQNQAEIDAHAFQPNAQPGDVKFRDVNGDGLITDEDRTYQGTTIPKYSYGLNFNAEYKNFDFSFAFVGQGGNKAYNGTYNGLMIGGLLNHSTDMLNYWTPENTNTNVPRPDVLERNANARPSSRFVQDAGYLRLQNIQLGYTLPLKDNKVFDKVRLYTSGQNIFVITDFTGYDPDFMNDGLLSRGFESGSFPNPRTFIFGIEASF